jgi:hypothetical protein
MPRQNDCSQASGLARLSRLARAPHAPDVFECAAMVVAALMRATVITPSVWPVVDGHLRGHDGL